MMTVFPIVLSIILLLLSGWMFFIAYRQFRERGIPLNNAYQFTTKEVRDKTNFRPLYRQSAIATFGLGFMFLFSSFHMITNWDWFFIITITLGFLIMIYSIISTIMIAKRRK